MNNTSLSYHAAAATPFLFFALRAPRFARPRHAAAAAAMSFYADDATPFSSAAIAAATPMPLTTQTHAHWNETNIDEICVGGAMPPCRYTPPPIVPSSPDVSPNHHHHHHQQWGSTNQFNNGEQQKNGIIIIIHRITITQTSFAFSPPRLQTGKNNQNKWNNNEPFPSFPTISPAFTTPPPLSANVQRTNELNSNNNKS